MNKREKIAVSRTVFIAVMAVIVSVMAVYNTIFNKGANFEAGISTPAQESLVYPASTVECLEEPEYAYNLLTLTFGGTCTPASMLGSRAYGTFNNLKNEMGTEYFLERIARITLNDDMTLVGCNAVLSDSSELNTADNAINEWYLSDSDTINIFSSAGIDTLSLECPRTMDYGVDGFEELKSIVEKSGILWGDSNKTIYQTIRDIKIAIHCTIYCESDRDEVLDFIKNASQDNDFIALYICDSDSASDSPSEAKVSLFREYVEAGADLIVGTNGKNLQYAEKYSDGYIVYSLGALIDGAVKYPEKYTSLLQVKISVDNGEIIKINYDLLPCITYDEEHAWCPNILYSGEEKESVLLSMNSEKNAD